MCGRSPQTGLIDYDKLEEKALDFRPQMIICGGSAYPREWEYERLRAIADKVGAYLMADMAHIRSALPPSRSQSIVSGPRGEPVSYAVVWRCSGGLECYAAWVFIKVTPRLCGRKRALSRCKRFKCCHDVGCLLSALVRD